MNLVLLFESDFIDAAHTIARLAGRRREHALQVCRVAVGDELRVGIVNGMTGTARVEKITGGFLELRAVFDAPPPPPLPLILILALPRPKSLRKCLEVSTTMGVKKIFVIESWRVEKSYWSSPVLSEESVREHLLLGLEQAGDTVLPRVEIRRRFKPFVEDEAAGIIAGTRAIVAHPYAPSECPRNLQCPVTLAIGPEGGFIPYEVELLERHGFESVTLGARVLRVEQAIPALVGRLF